MENPHVGAEKKRGLLVGNWLLSLKPDEVVVPEEHGGTATMLLREAGVDIRKPGEDGAGEMGGREDAPSG